MVYLVDNPPTRDQYRSPRRTTPFPRPTGLTCLHTAESVMDSVSADTGAESVAAFIRGRTEPGSYHDIVDSDSCIQLVRYGDEAYQDGTGSNPYALSISWALRTTDWVRLSATKRAAFLLQGARAFARQQAWLLANGYPVTPLLRVTRAQSEAGAAGFITHAERDPGRRSDPGKDFPWTEWFGQCARALKQTPEDDVTPDELVSAARTAISQMFDEAANRSTPTGKSFGNDLAVILSSAQPAPLDPAKLAEQLAPLLPDAADQATVEAALRNVLGSVDNPPEAPDA